jgi:hypothetical protein
MGAKLEKYTRASEWAGSLESAIPVVYKLFGIGGWGGVDVVFIGD